jgi:hypothetical protein
MDISPPCPGFLVCCSIRSDASSTLQLKGHVASQNESKYKVNKWGKTDICIDSINQRMVLIMSQASTVLSMKMQGSIAIHICIQQIRRLRGAEETENIDRS